MLATIVDQICYSRGVRSTSLDRYKAKHQRHVDKDASSAITCAFTAPHRDGHRRGDVLAEATFGELMACVSLDARCFRIFSHFRVQPFFFLFIFVVSYFRLTLLKRRTRPPGVRVVAPACVAKCLVKRRSTAEMHRKSSHRLFLFKFSETVFVFSLSK